MRIYITLPFRGTTRDKSSNLYANLTHDYELNFKTTSRYKFKRAWQMCNKKRFWFKRFASILSLDIHTD